MRFIAVIFFGFLMSSCIHTQPTGPVEKPRTVSTDERTKKSHMELSYKDLHTILLTVMFSVDGDQRGCPVKPDQLASLSQSYKALLDERFAKDKEVYFKKSKKDRAAFYPKDCHDDCSCEVYSQFLQYLEQDGVKLGATETKAQKKIHQSQAMSSRSPMACMEAEQPWACDSQIFKSLTLEQ